VEINTTMNKLNKILVAIDFSEPSFNALETAACQAEKSKAVLYIVHVRDTILESMGVSSFTKNSVANNFSSILNALASDIQRKSGIKTVIVEESGFTTEVLIKTAIHLACDLIVMGTYGASGYRNGYIGTTAYSTIKFAPCPILLIPAGKKWTSFRNPLFPVRPVVTALRHYDIIRNFLADNSTLAVLGLYHSEQDTVDDLNDLVTEMEDKLIVNKITSNAVWGAESSISENILSQADRVRPDLIIVTPAIDVSAKTFYIGPNTHKIIHNAKIPILVINKVNVYALSR
jgi:nucleotide-binding universal stress UspA family protein